MLKINKISTFQIVLLFLISLNFVIASSTGTIKGKIIDKSIESALPGANVFIDGTALGASTNIDGEYKIMNIPEGSYKLIISYLGYKNKTIKINIEPNKTIVLDFSLEAESIEGEEVVVTAQVLGQKQAINQQLSSSNIKNVVSSARIQEVPDANAAESVGRLPGVSILREGGEGNKVVIRGLDPKYSSITINGVSLSSSGANDRGADLSMISSSMLAGIEVSKSVTADMDANTIGGVVNFQLRDATSNELGDPKFSLNTQGGYNGLDNAKDKFRNYKVDGTFEDRYFDNRFGVFLQGSYQNRNLSSNELGVLYNPLGDSQIDYLIGNISLYDIWRLRERGNIVLSLDYKLPNGKIKFSNFLSSSSTEVEDRRQFYNVDRGANTQSFISSYSKNNLNTISNILNIENDISIFNIKASLSHSYSETDNPGNWTVTFLNSTAGIEAFGFESNLDPRTVVQSANNDISNTLLNTVSTNDAFASERAFTISLDFETDFNLSDNILSTIKFGGKYQTKNRSYNLTVTNGQAFGFASGAAIIDQLQGALPWFNHSVGDNLNVPLEQFIDRKFDFGRFLDDEYKMVYPMDFTRLHEMVDFMNENQLHENVTYNHNVGSSITNDYEGKEDIGAAYLMATIKFGQWLTVIPGVRYQQLKTVYTAPQGIQGPTSFAVYPNKFKTITSDHPYLLPNLLINVKPTDWFDIRLAYTNTLSYPDYVALSPRINVAQSSGTLQYNGFELKPIESQNFDVYLSFYNNAIGLFTVGGFLKEIKDLIYQFSFHPSADELVQYYPDWVENKNPIGGITVSKYLNNPFKVNNYGVELDWQTHLWYLPSFLSGIVFNINYTHIFSEAEYPIQMIKREGRRTTFIDTSYVAPLLYQPDDILNITLGYDYKDFSMRLSTIYTSDIFSTPIFWEQLRAYTDSYTRWDLTLKQKLPFVMKGLEIFMNYNNITGSRDASSISAKTNVPSRIQSYGSMLELGFRSKF